MKDSDEQMLLSELKRLEKLVRQLTAELAREKEKHLSVMALEARVLRLELKTRGLESDLK